MLFKIFSSKYYPAVNNNNKTPSELISLITEPLSFDNHGQCASISIMNNEEIPLTEQDKQEANNFNVCRICYSSGDLQSLINPCECSGTMGILHQNCLEHWLEISNTTKCEICHHEYEVIRYPKSLFYFLTNPIRSSDIRYLINDIILFIFLTTVVSWLTIINMSKIRITKTLYDSISYIILPLCVFLIYIIWCWVSFRYHIQVIKEWCSVNQLIRIINKKKLKTTNNLDHENFSLSRSDIDQQYSLLYALNHNYTHLSNNRMEENILPDICIVK